ncbi:MAG: hypothetical protein QOI00_2080, partial [Chloroflexota bacterium]|nr:hypothetical protein [Chloroflexota bacterium]
VDERIATARLGAGPGHAPEPAGATA